LITERQIQDRDTDAETLACLLGEKDRRATRVLLRGGTVISMDREVGDHVVADILVEGGKIASVGPDLAHTASDGQAVVVDVAGRVLIPGMHDTHRHCWQNQLRRLVPDLCGVEQYLALAHGSLAPHYRPEDVYAGTLISAFGCLDAGITCVMDFSHNSRTASHSDAAITAMADSGIRAVHATCAPLAGEWDEHWPADIARLRERYFASDDQLLSLRVGLLAVRVGRLAVSPEWLSFARDLDIGVSIDGVFGPAASAKIEQLGHDGLLGEDVTLIHCSDLPDSLWRLIADSGTTVSISPTSDAQLGIAASIPPIQQALDFGVRPSLSVDVEISLSGDFFTQMRVLLSTQRMLALNRRYRGESDVPDLIGVRDALEFATVQGAHANRLLHKVGTLTPGKEADIVVIDAQDVNTMPLNNAVGTVVSGADSRNVEMVFVAGNLKKWGGALVGHDLDALRKTVTESRDYVLAASGYELDILS